MGIKKQSPHSKLTDYRRKRDFEKTKEPEGSRTDGTPVGRRALRFVIQKHAASHLHYDLRLELDGVMKSWAVPKGPSYDPAVKRLAMEVEDHPIDYNTFEGTIPQGEYGGGTVMLWDRGTYTAENAGGVEALRAGYERGDLKFVLKGKRLNGGWVLVRMNRPGRPQWLLIKHRDEHARSDYDVTADQMTSVTTGRTMEEIAGRLSRPAAARKAATKKTATTARSKRTAKRTPTRRGTEGKKKTRPESRRAAS